MKTTETVARDKWCPLFKHNCKGTACMFWRWVRDEHGWAQNDSNGHALGYCGAAGSP